MVVHLSTGRLRGVEKGGHHGSRIFRATFPGTNRLSEVRARLETTGGGLPVRVQKLAVGNPQAPPTLRRSLLRRPLQRREFAAAGSPAFLTFSPGFLFSCRLFPHWSTASHPWAAGFLKESGILAPGLIFACRTRLQAFGAGLLSLKIRTPRRDKSDRFVPARGLLHMLHHPNRSSNQLPPPSSG